ncbi:MAG: GNAT family N-acetyltransferase [Thermoanaerobaculia bacterium]
MTKITTSAPSDLDEAVACLVAAFEQDPLTGFLLQTGTGYRDRLTRFFSLLMRARLALDMPVLVARDGDGIQGAAMGYSTVPPAWPTALAEEWDRFERAVPGFSDRMAAYDEIAAQSKPAAPHYYLGVLGVDPDFHGRGIGTRLLKAFAGLSNGDQLSSGVYLETSQASNVGFYESAGFAETGRGNLGSATLWCMYLPHAPR